MGNSRLQKYSINYLIIYKINLLEGIGPFACKHTHTQTRSMPTQFKEKKYVFEVRQRVYCILHVNAIEFDSSSKSLRTNHICGRTLKLFIK